MKEIISICILLIAFACSQKQERTLKNTLLKEWSISDSIYVDLLDFETIDQFDDYQYGNTALFDSIRVILSINDYKIEVIPEGNKLTNDMNIMPSLESRIIRFQFSKNGERLLYKEKEIELEESAAIITSRFKKAEGSYHQIISLVFEDSIKQAFIHQSLDVINDTYITIATKGLSPDLNIKELDNLEALMKKMARFRLVYAIGGASDRYVIPPPPVE